jgi:hypothetical protein
MWIGFNESLTGNQQKIEGSHHKKMQTMLCFVAPPKVSVESLSRWPPSKDFGLSLVPKISSDDCSHKSLELEEEQNNEVKKHLIKIMVSCKSSPKIRFSMVVLSKAHTFSRAAPENAHFFREDLEALVEQGPEASTAVPQNGEMCKGKSC